jgi:multidrug efflux pump subunit AcrB
VATDIALALGEGSELLQPVALSVIGGLAVGTLLTLVLLPGIYVIADDLRRRFRPTIRGLPK